MVVKKFILFTFLFFCYFNSSAQNSFYDDIHLMDYQRTSQLLNDSNGDIINISEGLVIFFSLIIYLSHKNVNYVAKKYI